MKHDRLSIQLSVVYKLGKGRAKQYRFLYPYFTIDYVAIVNMIPIKKMVNCSNQFGHIAI